MGQEGKSSTCEEVVVVVVHLHHRSELVHGHCTWIGACSDRMDCGWGESSCVLGEVGVPCLDGTVGDA